MMFWSKRTNRPPPGIDDGKDKTKSNREMLKTTQIGTFKLQPKFKLETPRLHTGAACDRPETTKTATFHQFPSLSGSNPRRHLQTNAT